MKMRNKLICIGAMCIILAGCGGHQALPSLGGGTSSHPQVVQNGTIPVQWTQFAWGNAVNNPHQIDGMVTGTDKNIWYTDYNGQDLIQITMAGKTKKIALTYGTGTHFYPGSIAVGADGKFYMSSASATGIIGVAKTTGSFSVITIPSGDYGYDGGLTLGSDGNIWFTELAHIAKITTGGAVTEFAYPDGNTANYYGSITTGPDGDLWATEYNVNAIDDVDPATGTITQYPLPCGANGVVAGNDGNLWVSCSGSLVRVTTGGSYTTFANPYSSDTYPTSFRVGPDGNPWFSVSGRNFIGEYNTTSNSITVYFPPSTYGQTYGITPGPDGNMWALDSTGHTDVYILNVLGVLPASINFHISNVQTLTVTEKGTTSWTATSSNPGVATVVQGSSANKFTVTAVGLGSTNVTVKDAIGNSFVVKVKVT
jgi:virginiamycin B lyase